jgi:hypothetical protein
MEIREVQLRATTCGLAFDRQIAALKTEIDAHSSCIRFASKADMNSQHG